MIKYYVIIFSLIIFSCKSGIDNNSSSKTEEWDISPTVLIMAETDEFPEPASSTGIVIDKEKGLILSSKHGVYFEKGVHFKQEDVFRKITILDQNGLRSNAYIVFISEKHDLAIIKSDQIFDTQGTFVQRNSIPNLTDIVFQGYAESAYKNSKGSISTSSKNHLNLNLDVTGGMSGGPIFDINYPNKIIGVVLLKQNTGGTALKGNVIIDMLNKNLKKVSEISSYTFNGSLNRIEFTEEVFNELIEKKSKVYLTLLINNDEKYKSSPQLIESKTIVLNDKIAGLEILPTDKVEIEIWHEPTFNLLKISSYDQRDKRVFYYNHEKFPQTGGFNFDKPIQNKGSKIYFTN